MEMQNNKIYNNEDPSEQLDEIQSINEQRVKKRFPMIFIGGLSITVNNRDLTEALKRENFFVTVNPKIRKGNSFCYCPNVALSNQEQIDRLLSKGKIWVKDRFADCKLYEERTEWERTQAQRKGNVYRKYNKHLSEVDKRLAELEHYYYQPPSQPRQERQSYYPSNSHERYRGRRNSFNKVHSVQKEVPMFRSGSAPKGGQQFYVNPIGSSYSPAGFSPINVNSRPSNYSTYAPEWNNNSCSPSPVLQPSLAQRQKSMRTRMFKQRGTQNQNYQQDMDVMRQQLNGMNMNITPNPYIPQASTPIYYSPQSVYQVAPSTPGTTVSAYYMSPIMSPTVTTPVMSPSASCGYTVVPQRQTVQNSTIQTPIIINNNITDENIIANNQIQHNVTQAQSSDIIQSGTQNGIDFSQVHACNEQMESDSDMRPSPILPPATKIKKSTSCLDILNLPGDDMNCASEK